MLRPMRRPLGNGMPLQMIDNGSSAAVVTLFDATTLDPTQVWQVSAYLWPALVGNTFPGYTSFRISLLTSGGPTVELVRMFIADATALFTAALVSGQPPLVLDKVTLRGGQMLVLEPVPAEVGSGGSIAAYGYFEMNATDPVPYDFRPLEPTPLVAPFNATPAVLEVALGAAVPVYTNAHLLNAQYADVVTLTALTQLIQGPAASNSLFVLKFPNGVQLPLSRTASGTGVTSPSYLLQDIPLLAPSSSNNALQIGCIRADTTAVMMQVASYGHFTRVS